MLIHYVSEGRTITIRKMEDDHSVAEEESKRREQQLNKEVRKRRSLAPGLL